MGSSHETVAPPFRDERAQKSHGMVRFSNAVLVEGECRSPLGLMVP